MIDGTPVATMPVDLAVVSDEIVVWRGPIDVPIYARATDYGDLIEGPDRRSTAHAMADALEGVARLLRECHG